MSPTELRTIAAQVKLAVFDFDGVFTDNRVLVFQDGGEAVFCNRSDGLGLEMLRRSGVQVLVLSKEKNPVVSARCRKLALECRQGIDLKAAVLREEAEKRGIDLAQTAYLGNDVNDLECLRLVGLPACVADAYPEVKAVSRHCTRAPGGFGAVREFCDLLLGSQEQPAGIRVAKDE